MPVYICGAYSFSPIQGSAADKAMTATSDKPVGHIQQHTAHVHILNQPHPETNVNVRKKLDVNSENSKWWYIKLPPPCHHLSLLLIPYLPLSQGFGDKLR